MRSIDTAHCVRWLVEYVTSKGFPVMDERVDRMDRGDVYVSVLIKSVRKPNRPSDNFSW